MTLAVAFVLMILAVLVIAVVAGIMAATGNKPRGSDEATAPTSPPAGPGAEGMNVSGPGEIAPGPPPGDDLGDG